MTYYPLEVLFKGIENVKVRGENILLGNSASFTNNHIEAFNFLKGINLEDRKIIMPLSYGDKVYGEKVDEIGKSIFGSKLESIFHFIPLSEFNELLSTCNVVIMNHYRQQAVGNIIATLWMGAKVYLNEKNTFYHYLKRIGVYVYSIEKDLISSGLYVLKGLDEEQVNHNREILKKEIGFVSMKNNLIRNLNMIINDEY